MEITVTALSYFPVFVFSNGTIAAKKTNSLYEPVQYYSRDSGVTWQQYNRNYYYMSAYGDDALAIGGGSLYRITADGQEMYIGNFDLRQKVTYVGGDYILYPYNDLYLLNIATGQKTVLASGSEGTRGMFSNICQTPGKYWIGYSHGGFYEYANGNVRRHDISESGVGALSQIIQLPDGTYIASFGKKPGYADAPGAHYSRDGNTWYAFYDKSQGSPFFGYAHPSSIGCISGTAHFDGVYLLQDTGGYDASGHLMPGKTSLYRFPLDTIWNYAMRRDISRYTFIENIASNVPVNCGGQIVVPTLDKTTYSYGYYYTESGGSALIWRNAASDIRHIEGVTGRQLPDYAYLLGDYKTNSLVGAAGIYIKTAQDIRQFAVTAGNIAQGKHIHIMTKHGEKVLYDAAKPFANGPTCCFWNGTEKRYLALLDS
ncbi:hypothetical protein [Treponema socranskii]|uniref:hypothetical protein n=1 Tax=Treponema socranskii TaxID=53419 RepID=UPI003D6F5AC2